MDLIQKIAQFLAEMIFYGMVDVVFLVGIVMVYFSYKKKKEDIHDGHVD